MDLPRTLRWAALAAALSVLVAGAVWATGLGADRTVRAPPRDEDRAMRVLAAWDRERAAAWAAGDAAALARLYLPTSSAGRRDARQLRAWTRHGWVVRGVTRQVQQVTVRQLEADMVRLEVVDRLVGAVAHRRDADPATPGRPLPQGQLHHRELEFQQGEHGWRIAGVREIPDGPGEVSLTRPTGTS